MKKGQMNDRNLFCRQSCNNSGGSLNFKKVVVNSNSEIRIGIIFSNIINYFFAKFIWEIYNFYTKQCYVISGLLSRYYEDNKLLLFDPTSCIASVLLPMMSRHSMMCSRSII